MDEILLDSH